MLRWISLFYTIPRSTVKMKRRLEVVARADSNCRPPACQSVVARHYNNLQNRGDSDWRPYSMGGIFRSSSLGILDHLRRASSAAFRVFLTSSHLVSQLLRGSRRCSFSATEDVKGYVIFIDNRLLDP